MKFLSVLILLMLSINYCSAVEYKKFDTPQQEQAYKVLINELRCLVCQNQTIADSNAELAQDLRRQVHEMLQQGKSKDEIADFMTQRYGDFVLYNPPFKAKTSLLWIGPVVFLLIGLVMLVLFSRKKKSIENNDISESELKKIQEKKSKIKGLLEKGEQL
jgi:cytochrome c-type biogenesis protein CcmH